MSLIMYGHQISYSRWFAVRHPVIYYNKILIMLYKSPRNLKSTDIKSQSPAIGQQCQINSAVISS